MSKLMNKRCGHRWHPTRNSIKTSLIGALCWLVLGVGCSQNQCAELSAQESCSNGEIIISVRRVPALLESHGGSGLVAAVLRDGTVVRVVSVNQIGKEYIEGRITQSQLDDVLAYARQLRLDLNSRAQTMVTDAAGFQVYIRVDNQVFRSGESIPLSENSVVDAMLAYLLQLPLRGTHAIERNKIPRLS